MLSHLYGHSCHRTYAVTNQPKLSSLPRLGFVGARIFEDTGPSLTSCRLSGDDAARKAFGAHVSENLHHDQVFAVCAPFKRSSAVFATQHESLDGPSFDRHSFRNKKFTGPQRRTKKNAALQIGSKGIELVTHCRLLSSFDWFFQSMMLFTLHTFAIDEAEDGREKPTVRILKTGRQVFYVR